MSDRYLKVVLTIIAAELGWIALTHGAQPVSAQAAATPVVITGIEIRDTGAYLPVGVMGSYRSAPPRLEKLRALVETDRALQVSVPVPLDVRTVLPVKIEADRPIKIEADRPIKVESVPYTPSLRPGE